MSETTNVVYEDGNFTVTVERDEEAPTGYYKVHNKTTDVVEVQDSQLIMVMQYVMAANQVIDMWLNKAEANTDDDMTRLLIN